MRNDRELHKAVLAVMLGQKGKVEEAKKPLHPNQQKIDVHEPEKDELTAKDFEMLRAGKKAKMKEETEVEEAYGEFENRGKQTSGGLRKLQSAITKRMTDEKPPIKTANKPSKMPKPMKEENSQVTEQEEDNASATVAGHKVTLHRHLSEPGESDTYTIHHPSGARKVKISYEKHGDGSEVHGEKVNKAFGLEHGHKLGHKIASSMNGMGGISKFQESVELYSDADETIFVHTPIEFEIKESYVFGDYLTAAKKLVGEEEAINVANEKFKSQDVSIFAEEFMRSDIEDKVNAHTKAGHKVSAPKYMTKSGKPYAEYVVTDKESGVRRKYIHHGNARSVENMGAAGKKDE